MNNYPAWLKLPMILLGLVLFFFIMQIGREILIPLFFAMIVAILLNPVAGFMQRYGVGRVLSILVSVLLFVLFVGGIFFFIGSQFARFRDSLPELTQRFTEMSDDFIDWVCTRFNLDHEQVDSWIAEQKTEGIQKMSTVLGNTIVTIGGAAVAVLLIPVYIFLFLFYKPLILDFIGRAFSSDKHTTVSAILMSTRTLVQSYLVGLITELFIVTTLYSIALLIIGVKYAVVVGLVGALLNLIPYVGGVIAVTFAMIMAVLTKTPVSALYVLIAYSTIQIIDNNFLVPKIVAGKVKINALVSIVAVIFWGSIWGVAGMFLSIPLTALFKVVFDRVEPLKPYGLLLGDTMPPIGKGVFRVFSRPAESAEKPKAEPPEKPKEE